MAMPGEPDEFTPLLGTLQVVHGAMIAGASLFLALVVVLNGTRPPRKNAAGLDLLTWAAVGSAVMAVAAAAVVVPTITRLQRRQIARGPGSRRPRGPADPRPATEAGKLALVYLAVRILCPVILEVPTLFTLIVFLMGGRVISLAVGLALILVQTATFPTRPGFDRWMETQLRLIEEERQVM